MVCALLLLVIAALTVPGSPGVGMYDIATVWGLERLHTWTWQYSIVSFAVFTTGRKRELFEKRLRCATGKTANTIDDAAGHDTDSSTVKPHAIHSESSDAVERVGLLSEKESNDRASEDLPWQELQQLAHSDAAVVREPGHNVV